MKKNIQLAAGLLLLATMQLSARGTFSIKNTTNQTCTYSSPNFGATKVNNFGLPAGNDTSEIAPGQVKHFMYYDTAQTLGRNQNVTITRVCQVPAPIRAQSDNQDDHCDRVREECERCSRHEHDQAQANNDGDWDHDRREHCEHIRDECHRCDRHEHEHRDHEQAPQQKPAAPQTTTSSQRVTISGGGEFFQF